MMGLVGKFLQHNNGVLKGLVFDGGLTSTALFLIPGPDLPSFASDLFATAANFSGEIKGGGFCGESQVCILDIFSEDAFVETLGCDCVLLQV